MSLTLHVIKVTANLEKMTMLERLLLNLKELSSLKKKVMIVYTVPI